MKSAKDHIVGLLRSADIEVGGNFPQDIQVHNEDFFQRVLSEGSLGLGESYMDGWWDSERLDEFFYKVLISKLDKKVKPNFGILMLGLQSRIMNMQNRSRATEVAELHYDIDFEVYKTFLDPYNQYTCGYFKDTNDLNEAQESKLELICKKLGITRNDRVLDIGCGWGGFAKFAAEHHGCEVTGISISDEQIKHAKESTRGLPVRILKRDYRELSDEKSFDKVLICGMIEHVGYKNYREIMEIVNKALKDDGLFLLHTIGGNTSVTHTDPWIGKYIFPNSMVPSLTQLNTAAEGLFVLEDLHNFSANYDKTLMAWHRNFNNNWNGLKEKGYDDRFHRMFDYYFLSCAGSFRARKNQLWQMVMSKEGVPGGYESVR